MQVESTQILKINPINIKLSIKDLIIVSLNINSKLSMSDLYSSSLSKSLQYKKLLNYKLPKFEIYKKLIKKLYNNGLINFSVSKTNIIELYLSDEGMQEYNYLMQNINQLYYGNH
tara:strand:+ start:60 stop:404 length:345 start_codon:yes stop_codon:yes gene_type:complete